MNPQTIALLERHRPVVRRHHDHAVAPSGQGPSERVHAQLGATRREGWEVFVDQADLQSAFRATTRNPVLSPGSRTAASRFHRLSRAYSPRDTPPTASMTPAHGVS